MDGWMDGWATTIALVNYNPWSWVAAMGKDQHDGYDLKRANRTTHTPQQRNKNDTIPKK
jgi:hypothetical protein